jgi:hypothetical protein
VSFPTFLVRLTNEVVKQKTSKLEALDESYLLSDVFKDPAARTLHVVVKFPPIGERLAAEVIRKMIYVASMSTAANVVYCSLLIPFLRFCW